jgi:trehalose-6-phosphate synthase
MLEEYQKTFEGKKVLLAVDRLDYIKGIPHRLKAFQLFLQNYPEWRNKVVFIQVAVPSRTDVEEYKRLKIEVETLGTLFFSKYHFSFSFQSRAHQR